MDEHLHGAVARALSKEDEDEAEDEEKGTHQMNPEAREHAAALAEALEDDGVSAEEVIDAVQNRRQAEPTEDEKGVDDEEDREETSEDFNPANTPENLDQHPYDEAEWQEDYDREREEKECDHTDHRGRPLDEEECPWCGGEEE